MILHISLRWESFSTFIAAIRLFFCMFSYMYYHIRFFWEHLPTTINWTLEWLSAKMYMHVCIESSSSWKTFLASYIIAIIPRFNFFQCSLMLFFDLFFRNYCELRFSLLGGHYFLLSLISWLRDQKIIFDIFFNDHIFIIIIIMWIFHHLWN